MFDEELFNVFNEASSSAEKSGSQRESGSSRDADTVSKHRDTKGEGFENTDNKRYERYCLKQLNIGVARRCTRCTRTPRAEKKYFGAKFTGESCKCTPRQGVHPSRQSKSLWSLDSVSVHIWAVLAVLHLIVYYTQNTLHVY